MNSSFLVAEQKVLTPIIVGGTPKPLLKWVKQMIDESSKLFLQLYTPLDEFLILTDSYLRFGRFGKVQIQTTIAYFGRTRSASLNFLEWSMSRATR